MVILTKEIAPISTLASIRRWRLRPPTQKSNKNKDYDDSDLGASFLIVSRSDRSCVAAATSW
jgi:hypothetical protein